MREVRPASEPAKGRLRDCLENTTQIGSVRDTGLEVTPEVLSDSVLALGQKRSAAVLTICAQSAAGRKTRTREAEFRVAHNDFQGNPPLDVGGYDRYLRNGGGIFVPCASRAKNKTLICCGEHQVVLDIGCKGVVAKLRIGSHVPSISDLRANEDRRLSQGKGDLALSLIHISEPTRPY